MKQDAALTKLATRFVMEILLPKKIFIEKYKLAKKTYYTQSMIVQRLSEDFAVTKKLVEMRISDILPSCFLY